MEIVNVDLATNSQIENMLNISDILGESIERSRRSSSVPMILMPSQSDRECIPSNQLSSIGFMGLMISLINAAINMVNNVNNNNNNRNNNNNDNNDNNANINIANLNSDTMNMQTAMAGRSLWSRLKRLMR